MIININTPKKYEIIIKKGAFENIEPEIKKIYNGVKIVIITDENIYNLYGDQLTLILKKNYKLKTIIIKPGENSKSMETLAYVYEMFSGFLKRSDLVLAFGGGVVGDLTGFAASTFMRGVKFIQIPTTLLSQVDSSVGGKTAINLPNGKNLAGSFYHPEKVIIDPLFLNSLPEKYFYDGMGEMIKYACIKDRDLFNDLKKSKEDTYKNIEKLIYTCLNIKKELVEKDDKDYGIRMLLNFGHTLGHAIEKHFDYSISHGQAVCMGMYHITKNSQRLGFTKPGVIEDLTKLFKLHNINYNLPISTADIMKYIHLDKKNDSDFINLVLLKELGNAFIKKIQIRDLNNFVRIEQEKL